MKPNRRPAVLNRAVFANRTFDSRALSVLTTLVRPLSLLACAAVRQVSRDSPVSEVPSQPVSLVSLMRSMPINGVCRSDSSAFDTK